MADWRELVDRAVAASALMTLSPLLGVISLVVKATSKGPVLYQAEMLGENASAFKMKKFRSMVQGSTQLLSKDDKTIVAKDDPRLTIIGPFLRVGIDELPQLINILAGEMAFVGPRPDPTWVLPRYTPSIRGRLRVRPGITGLSQVLDGRRQRQAVIYFLDNCYIEHKNLAVDIAILALTIPYVLGVRAPGKLILERLLAGAASKVEQYELLPAGDCPQPSYVEKGTEQEPVPAHEGRIAVQEGLP